MATAKIGARVERPDRDTVVLTLTHSDRQSYSRAIDPAATRIARASALDYGPLDAGADQPRRRPDARGQGPAAPPPTPTGGGDGMYQCRTCPERVAGLAAARRHAKQGHRTQRDAFHAGQLHSLELVPK